MTQPSPKQPGETDAMTATPCAPGHESDQAIHEKLRDALTPGFAAAFDPAEAQRAVAVVEDALSEADAAESAPDLEEALTQRKIGD